MPSSEKSKCCGAYVTRRFFMPCYSCACLMGDSVLLHCCICGRTGLLPYMERNRNDEENLSVATYMNYTRLFQQLPDNSPLVGAQTFVQLLAKCNPYTPQR